MPELRRAREVIERLRLPIREATLRRWANQGVVPATRVNKKTLLFDVAEVARALGAAVREEGEESND